jgi:hypothetical protein
LSICVNDHTGTAWLQGFNEIGNEIIGKTAEELHQMKTNVRFSQLANHYHKENEDAFRSAIQEACFKNYIFRIRAKHESYNVLFILCSKISSCQSGRDEGAMQYRVCGAVGFRPRIDASSRSHQSVLIAHQ